MLRITLVLFIVGDAVVAESFPSPCPDVKTVPDLNLNRFTGKWFKVARYYAKFEVGAECTTFDYSPAKGGAVHIKISQTILAPDVPAVIDSTTTPIGKRGNAKWTIKQSSLPSLNNKPHWIVATDYDNWALLWSCSESEQYTERYSWVLARKGYQLPDAKLKEAYNAAERNQISTKYFQKTNPEYCH